ncbi:MAG TPA: aspartate carbamoyltransferase catalytic subunit [Oligoflexia bacterium]|nr:aspartate carbamoyltransferase catalytic subunit [Oligoflexia bacterium]HMP47540.1 aspartate carbamoyltransferase catalytic subunit [Oligoflexia bacterium]
MGSGESGFHKHLLGIRGLTREDVNFFIDTSQSFVEVNTRSVKKVPALRGKTIINLFLEPSTRTRSSFEIAGKRLSADVINISGSSSSTTKGETLVDTLLNIRSMQPDVVVIRHAFSGSCELVRKMVPGTSIINAGDGLHEHPTQALLDALTLRQHFGSLEGLKLTIVGDVLRSRVARSNIFLHLLFGNEVRIVAPPTIAQSYFRQMGVKIYHHMDQALPGSDVVMSLRMKHEYQKDFYVPNLDEYAKRYIVSESIIKKYCEHAVVMAPGPIIRGTEITSEVADGPRSLILKQVSNGVAVRMAVLFLLATGNKNPIHDLEDGALSEDGQ